MRASNVAPPVVIAALMISSALWIVHDERAWWWDTANYGYWTLNLWQERHSGLGAWANAMIHVLAYKPPLMIWLAQFCVPFRHFTGEFESAILFVNLFSAA